MTKYLARDDKGYQSFVPGAVEAAQILYFEQALRVGDEQSNYETKLVQADSDIIEAKTEKITVRGTRNGVVEKAEHVCYIRYDVKNNKLESDITKDSDILTREEARCGDDLFIMSCQYALVFPVAAWLAKNKPYCYEVLKAIPSGGGTTASIVRNIIRIGLFDMADEFERTFKANPQVEQYFRTQSVEDILRRFSGKAVPSQCREWIRKNRAASAHETEFLEVLLEITEKEDGNNAVIFCKYFERASKMADARAYNYGTSISNFLRDMKTLLGLGYNSKNVLEYITRQNFYFSRPFGFPMEEMGNLADYAHMSHMLFGDDYERFPSNIQRTHNIVASNKELVATVDEETEEKFKEAVAKYKHLEATVTLSGKKWVLKAPTCSRDVVNEGVALNHCVSSYVNLIIAEVSQIMFLRDAENPDASLYTVEVINGEITEAKGNYNEELPLEAVEALKAIKKLWKGTVL